LAKPIKAQDRKEITSNTSQNITQVSVNKSYKNHRNAKNLITQ